MVEEVKYTIDDIQTLPEGQRAELLDGKMYTQAAPSTSHQRLVRYFSWCIESCIRENHGKCEVFPAPFAVFLNETNYLEPDLSVICDPDKIDERGCHGAPDWVIEIVSPSTRTLDYGAKLLKYLNYGVREYWIVDPEKERVTVWNFPEDSMNEYAFSDEIPVGIYAGFKMRIE